jgi:pimeloyl-ACP methyl ester carboxylesterase
MTERDVQIRVGSNDVIHGDLVVPDDSCGLVVLAHGSGSSRRSPRNGSVARALQHRGFATLLFDLLTSAEGGVEQQTGQLRFDIGLLAERLERAVGFVEDDQTTARLPVGLFGASTGAPAALCVAARRPERIAAVVSRGGRPDLAGDALSAVQAPTLLIVGGQDKVVIDLNHHAAGQLRCAHDVAVVPGATHLFEEPGALDEVARLAGDWFTTHLPVTNGTAGGGGPNAEAELERQARAAIRARQGRAAGAR